MRGVGVGLAGLSVVAMGFALAGAVAAEEQAPEGDPAAAVEASPDDYYTRRAKDILAAEKSRAASPHPLAAAYPGMDIVVCEAGCTAGAKPYVVSVRPRPAPAATEREGRMMPTSDDGSATPGTSVAEAGVTCIAGCYGDSEPTPVPAAAVGDWSTHAEPKAPPVRDKLSPVR